MAELQHQKANKDRPELDMVALANRLAEAEAAVARNAEAMTQEADHLNRSSVVALQLYFQARESEQQAVTLQGRLEAHEAEARAERKSPPPPRRGWHDSCD